MWFIMIDVFLNKMLLNFGMANGSTAGYKNIFVYFKTGTHVVVDTKLDLPDVYFSFIK